MTGWEYDTATSVRDAHNRRWPAPDGIPFLRANRGMLAAEALACLDRGDTETALVLLLADQDDWWRGPTADPAALRHLIRQKDELTLREAMGLLSWGPVADYFAHRWSDPTFLAGLALTEAHWTTPRTGFELACGIGHHLRALAGQGVQVTGADVVFAKLWIARHFVAPTATLVCFDAAQDWPQLDSFDLITCHDAFYFLEPKSEILARLHQLADPARGVLVVSHIHNRDWANFSAGRAVSAAEVTTLFPGAVLYDDAALTRALTDCRTPAPASAAELAGAEAFAAATGPGLPPPWRVTGRLILPSPGTALRRNPLYDTEGRLTWPSDRYRLEYAARATYPARSGVPVRVVLTADRVDQVRRRELLDLPERW